MYTTNIYFTLKNVHFDVDHVHDVSNNANNVNNVIYVYMMM